MLDLSAMTNPRWLTCNKLYYSVYNTENRDYVGFDPSNALWFFRVTDVRVSANDCSLFSCLMENQISKSKPLAR